MYKKIISAILMICISLAEVGVFAEGTSNCNRYSGNNIEAQNYQNWANTETSYLTDCKDGTFMRFQANALDDYYIAEYYSSDFKLIYTVKIEKELPLFGAYYATDNYYFILSGQNNEEESPNVEVFRITKYDKNWKRVTSTGLSDCNTVAPFECGTSRMTDSDGYLIIRTSHKMYMNKSDGKNHEANVTIQVDIEQMKITDYLTAVSSSKAGYVSHSFNQFVKVENGSIVAVDHGDAYPRSIVLMNYPTKVSSGKFNTYSVSSTNMLSFDGSNGQNFTGASVGGFEISNTSYLLACNHINYEGYDWSQSIGGGITYTIRYSTGKVIVYKLLKGYDARNVYVSVKSKSGSNVELKQVTNLDGTKTATTPQLVKINDNRFLILWTQKKITPATEIPEVSAYSGYYLYEPENKVYYAELDAEGNMISEIKSINGNLSDCQPIVYNGSVIWYTWQDNVNNFYKIDISDTLSADVKSVNYEHSYDNGTVVKEATYDEEGIIRYTCKYCGESYEKTIPKKSYNVGDVNHDDVIDIRDATIIQKYVINIDVDIDLTLADFNSDGRVNVKDITLIQKHIVKSV